MVKPPEGEIYYKIKATGIVSAHFKKYMDVLFIHYRRGQGDLSFEKLSKS